MENDYKRLQLEFANAMREINRATIQPTIPPLHINDLKPLITLIARARASYLSALLEISRQTPEGLPSADTIARLKSLRECYEELVHAGQALEIAVEREYLDVKKK